MSVEALDEILHPQSVAVVGASANTRSWGYSYTHHLREYGFRGKIYPVNPNHAEILGIKAYSSLIDIPGTVDYVISCIPAGDVPTMLTECIQKEVKVVHLYTARFSETGRKDAAEMEQAILEQAREAGIRLIGPNCMGVYYPKHGLSFGYDLAKEPGPVGMLSQTGGGASGFVRQAARRGIRFSKVISYGNALDLNECDYLEYFDWDLETSVIAIYIEGPRDGRKFFDMLRRVALKKPVIIIKGGRGEAGTRVTASHTASLAGSMSAWEALVKQTGAIPAANLDEMADLAISFCLLPPFKGARVGIAGGGGGPSVLSADECEEAGLEVVALPAEIRQELKDKGVEIWDWIGNPVDASIIGGFGVDILDMLRVMALNENFDLLIGLINENVMLTLSQQDGMIMRMETTVEGYRRLKEETHKPLLAVIGDDCSGSDEYGNWNGKLISEARTNLIAAGIPFYPTIDRAASAARKVLDYYTYKNARTR
jgi:acyl-CoA synthetase (NDP forming)